jgi:spore cortex formation protein SpoVR/YcgB (stage V sporulation)
VQKDKGIVNEISDDQGYRNVRATLAQSYNPINYVPDIVVRAAKLKKDRKLVLEYRPYQDRLLHKDYAEKTLKYVKYLWGYDVEIVQLLEGHEITIYKE